MTFLQRLRGILNPRIAALCAARTTYDAPGTVAEQMRSAWEGATVRDPVFRETMERRAVQVNHAAVSCLWRFGDGSVLVANDREIFVL